MRSGGEPIYSIGAVSRMVGVSPVVLRSWEERYAVVVPFRTQGGHRLYTAEQVEQLRFIQELISAGAQAADAHRALAQRVAEERTTPNGASAGRTSVLLAERDVYGAELLEHVLSNEGYDVTLAADADDVVVRSSQHPFDLVVIELVISGGVGLRVCRQLTELGARVLAVSSLDVAAAAADAGASAFLVKPLDPRRLVSVANDLVVSNGDASPSDEPVSTG